MGHMGQIFKFLYLFEYFMWSGLESKCWEAEFSPSSTSLSSSIYVSINKVSVEQIMKHKYMFSRNFLT